jgi:hypothetical protein
VHLPQAQPTYGKNPTTLLPCCCPAVNEEVIRTAADRLVELGLVAAGYNYLNLDGACLA